MELDRIKSLEQRLQKLRQFDVLLNIKVGSEPNDQQSPVQSEQVNQQQKKFQANKENNRNTKNQSNSFKKEPSENEESEEFEISESEESEEAEESEQVQKQAEMEVLEESEQSQQQEGAEESEESEESEEIEFYEKNNQKLLQQMRDQRKKVLQTQKQTLEEQINQKQNLLEEHSKKIGPPKRSEQTSIKQQVINTSSPQKQRSASQERNFNQNQVHKINSKLKEKFAYQQQQEIYYEKPVYLKKERPQTAYIQQAQKQTCEKNQYPVYHVDVTPKKLPFKSSPKKVAVTPYGIPGGLKVKKVDRVARFQQLQKQWTSQTFLRKGGNTSQGRKLNLEQRNRQKKIETLDFIF